MIKLKFILLIVSFFPSFIFSQNLEKLKSDIINLLKNNKGTYGFVFQELNNPNNKIYFNENEVFNPGSTIKTCIMVQIYKDVFNNKLNLRQPVKIVNSFNSIVDSSNYSMDLTKLSWDPLANLVDSTITLYELNKAMIINSSNIAMNNALLLISPHSVNQLMQSLGLKNTKINRLSEDYKAEKEGINNNSTVYDMMLLYQKLYNKELFSPDISEQMLNVLKAQKINHLLPLHLPNEVVIAHKTGTINKGVHDCGIVYPQNGRDYLIMFFSKDLNKNEEGIRVGAEVSKLVYNFVTNCN
jgi:beta-lactamase class A